MSLSDEGRRRAGREATELLQGKDVLLQEMQHRVANSLQIIASILMLKARTVQSAEARLHLEDACHRILSVATVQRQIEIAAPGERIQLGPHLSRLCATLAASMIGDSRRTSLQVKADVGVVLPDDVMSIGLIVTELVINALKYAFPNCSEGKILVRYTVHGANWRLSVSDNGVGLHKGAQARTGMGTSIVAALAKQLDARVETWSNSYGTRVFVTHEISDREWSASHDMEDWPPKSKGHSVG
jgi:two-component sensor histidine kinase